jgi:serine/threonine protein kinase/tetratricopeptide (TPR) repeat protein
MQLPQINDAIQSRYQIRQLIGEGGTGYIYLAYDNLKATLVALKIIKDGFGEIIRREYQALAELPRHPNIVEVFDFGQLAPATCYMTMEYVLGRNLREYAKSLRETANPANLEQRLAEILVEVCQGLHFIHSNHYIHHDIKPDNLLCHESPSLSRIKLIDFGFLKKVHLHNRSDPLQGSPHYLAPEMLKDIPPDPRVDLYSLGVVLYELSTGNLPFRGGSTEEIIYHHLHTLPLPPRQHNPAISPFIEEIILRLLAKDPNKRYPGALALLRDIFRHGLSPQPIAADDNGYTLTTAFVGREREFLPLTESFDRLCRAPVKDLRHSGKLILIRGEEGSGKSRLLKEFKYHVQLHGGTYLEGHCHDFSGQPFAGWRQIFTGLFRLAYSNRGRWAAQYLPYLRRVYPDVAEGVLGLTEARSLVFTELTADQAEILLFIRLSDFLQRLLQPATGRKSSAETRLPLPMVLVIKGIEQADQKTLDFLAFLTTRLAHWRLLICLAGEPPFPESLSRKLADISTSGLSEIELSRLRPEDTEKLLRSKLGESELEHQFTNWIQAETEGIPLFVEELVEYLIHARLLRFREGRWQLSKNFNRAIIPHRTETVLSKQLAALDSEELALLTLAAILGRQFSLEQLLVLGAEDFTPEQIRFMVDKFCYKYRLFQEYLIPPNRSLQFDKKNLQQLLVRKIPAARKPQLHSRIGQFLRQQYEQNPNETLLLQVCHHLSQGTLADKILAVSYITRAAQAADQNNAPDSAREYYEKALKLHQTLPRSARLNLHLSPWHIIERLGDAAAETGNFETSLARYEEIVAEPSCQGRWPEIFLKMANVLSRTNRFNEAFHTLDRITTLDSAASEPYFELRFQDIRARIHNRHGNPDMAREILKDALQRIPPTLKDRELQLMKASILHTLAEIYLTGRDFNRAYVYGSRALAIRQLFDRKNEMYLSYNLLARIFYSTLTGMERAREYYQRCLKLTQELKNVRGEASEYGNLGIGHLMRGEIHAALLCFQKNVELLTKIGITTIHPYHDLLISRVYLGLGHYSKAISFGNKGLIQFQKNNQWYDVLRVKYDQAVTELYRGNYQRALCILLECRQMDQELKIHFPPKFILLQMAIVYLKLGALVQASSIFSEIEPHLLDQEDSAFLMEYHFACAELDILRQQPDAAFARIQQIDRLLLTFPQVEYRAENERLTAKLLIIYHQSDEALVRLQRAHEAIRQAGNIMIAAKIQRLMAEIYRLLGKDFDAEELLEESSHTFRKIGAKHEMALNWLARGQLLAQMLNYEESQECYRSAEKIFRKLGVRLDLAKCLHERAKIAQLLGDSAMCQKYSKEGHALLMELQLPLMYGESGISCL